MEETGRAAFVGAEVVRGTLRAGHPLGVEPGACAALPASIAGDPAARWRSNGGATKSVPGAVISRLWSWTMPVPEIA